MVADVITEEDMAGMEPVERAILENIAELRASAEWQRAALVCLLKRDRVFPKEFDEEYERLTGTVRVPTEPVSTADGVKETD